MKQSNSPSVITTPFSNSGSKNTIPQTSSTGATDGLASWSTGFPDSTMTPISAGGIPPHGKDFNGILNSLSTAIQWSQIGGLNIYDQTVATAIGGYPKGAIVLGSDGETLYQSTSNSNDNDPDGDLGSSFWATLATESWVTGTASAASAKKWTNSMTLTMTGTATGYASINGASDVSILLSTTGGYITNGYWSEQTVGSDVFLTQDFSYTTSTLGEVTITFPKAFSAVPVVTHSYKDANDGVSAISNIMSITSTTVTLYNRALTSAGWVNSSGTLWIHAVGPA